MENNPQNLRGQPELEDELKSEARLTDWLAKLPDAPLPSNFTARVLAAIEREEINSARSAVRGWDWRRLFPRLATATAIFLLIGSAAVQYGKNLHRQQIAHSLAMVARADALPSVDALENLDAIQRIGQSARADGELLAVMQ
jgi:hypothetical protein